MSQETEICSICLYKLKSSVRSLPCSHQFHASCLTSWLNKSSDCPLCRQEIDSSCESCGVPLDRNDGVFYCNSCPVEFCDHCFNLGMHRNHDETHQTFDYQPCCHI
jgi:Ring finger domain